MRWLLLIPILVVLILFGLSNRQPVELALWPIVGTWSLPLSIAVFGFGAIAFLFGALVTWWAALRYRRRARRLEEAARVLEAELAELRGRLAREVGPVPPSAGSTGTALVTLASRRAA